MLEKPIFDVKGFEAHGMCKSAPGVELYYALFGKGSTKVFLIMGIATSGFAWKNQVEYFAQFPEYQVCIMDNRGSGRTVTPGGRITTSQMAHDVVTLLHHLGWNNQKVHLVGNSLGGMVAQEVALRVPDQLATLTLISTHAGGWKSYIPPFGAMWSMSRQLFARSNSDRAKIVLETVFSKNHLAKPGNKDHLSIVENEYPTILDFYVDSLSSGGFLRVFAQENAVYMFVQQLSAVLTHRVSFSRLAKLKGKFPVLVCTGTRDLVVHTSHSQHIASALGGDLRQFAGAGHALTEECLDEINDAMKAHFTRGVTAA
jgi:pimeloyl-ACP methyl ester carboxylesterase